MSKCKNCLSEEVCRYNDGHNLYCKDEYVCPHFTARSEWVKLPCNIGKTFFRPISWRNTIDKCTVSSLTQKADETWKIRLTSGVFRTTFEITINDIGKTVFLTRKDSEKALEGMKEDG